MAFLFDKKHHAMFVSTIRKATRTPHAAFIERRVFRRDGIEDFLSTRVSVNGAKGTVGDEDRILGREVKGFEGDRAIRRAVRYKGIVFLSIIVVEFDHPVTISMERISGGIRSDRMCGIGRKEERGERRGINAREVGSRRGSRSGGLSSS